MNANPHRRARDLLAESWMGTLAEQERRWLQEHLSGCPECAGEAGRLRDTVAAFRAVPVRADAALVQATRRSARLYAQRLREAESRERMLLLSSALVAVWGAFTLPWLWRAVAWLADLLPLPDPAALVVTIFLWTLPAASAAALLLACRRPEDSGSPASPAIRLDID